MAANERELLFVARMRDQLTRQTKNVVSALRFMGTLAPRIFKNAGRELKQGLMAPLRGLGRLLHQIATQPLRMLGRGFTRVGGLGARAFRRLLRSGRSALSFLRRQVFSLRALLLTLGIGFAIGGFAEFEASLANVKTLTDDARVTIRGMADDVERVGAITGDRLDSLSQALFDIVSAGVPAGKAIKVLEQASKLAVAGATSTKSAAKGILSILNAYNLEAERAEEVSDSLFQAQRGGITTIQLLSENIGKLAPVFRIAGGTIDEMLASVAALTKTGLSTEESITALRAFMNSLIKPTKAARDAAKELGIEWNTAALRSMGFLKFIQQLNKATGATEAQLNALSNNNIRAFVAVAGLAADEAKNLGNLLGSMGQKAGSTAKAFELQSRQLKAQLGQLRNEFLAVRNAVFFEAKPGGENLINQLRDFARWLKSRAPEIAAGIRLVTDVLVTFFDFLAGRVQRFAEDPQKLWEDLATGIEFFVEASGQVILTQLKIIGQAILFTVQGVIAEVTNAFRGFSISDAIFGGDAFKQRADLARQGQQLTDHIIRLRAQIAEGLARADDDARLRATEAFIPGIGAVSGADPLGRARIREAIIRQVEAQQEALEEALNERRDVFRKLGTITPEEFGKGFDEAAKGFLENAVDTLGDGLEKVGESGKRALEKMGADGTLEKLDAAWRRFQQNLDLAQLHREARPFREELQKQVDLLVGVTEETFLKQAGTDAKEAEQAAKKLRDEVEKNVDLLTGGAAGGGGAGGGGAAAGAGRPGLGQQIFGQLRHDLVEFEEFLTSQFAVTVVNTFVSLERGVGDSLFNLFTGDLDKIKQTLRNFFRDILRAFSDFVSRLLVRGLLVQALGLFGGASLSSAPGGGGGSLSGPVAAAGGLGAFANGGVLGGTFIPFSAIPQFQGGVPFVGRATLGVIGEGRFPEAVVPLPDGRSIPIDPRFTRRFEKLQLLLERSLADDGHIISRKRAAGRRRLEGATVTVSPQISITVHGGASQEDAQALAAVVGQQVNEAVDAALSGRRFSQRVKVVVTQGVVDDPAFARALSTSGRATT